MRKTLLLVACSAGLMFGCETNKKSETMSTKNTDRAVNVEDAAPQAGLSEARTTPTPKPGSGAAVTPKPPTGGSDAGIAPRPQP